MPALHLQWASVGLVWMIWVLSSSIETLPSLLPSDFLVCLASAMKLLWSWSLEFCWNGLCYVLFSTMLPMFMIQLPAHLFWRNFCPCWDRLHFSPSFCSSPSVPCGLEWKASALWHSLSQVCGSQHPCTGSPCSVLNQSHAWCCDPSHSNERRPLETEWGWREEGNGVFPSMCSAVIRVTQPKDFSRQDDHWGIICSFSTISLTMVVFKVQCRLIRKCCLFI